MWNYTLLQLCHQFDVSTVWSVCHTDISPITLFIIKLLALCQGANSLFFCIISTLKIILQDSWEVLELYRVFTRVPITVIYKLQSVSYIII
jgi:hypothetical protein